MHYRKPAIKILVHLVASAFPLFSRLAETNYSLYYNHLFPAPIVFLWSFVIWSLFWFHSILLDETVPHYISNPISFRYTQVSSSAPFPELRCYSVPHDGANLVLTDNRFETHVLSLTTNGLHGSARPSRPEVGERYILLVLALLTTPFLCFCSRTI